MRNRLLAASCMCLHSTAPENFPTNIFTGTSDVPNASANKPTCIILGLALLKNQFYRSSVNNYREVEVIRKQLFTAEEPKWALPALRSLAAQVDYARLCVGWPWCVVPPKSKNTTTNQNTLSRRRGHLKPQTFGHRTAESKV
jgi:hypothetical protein